MRILVSGSTRMVRGLAGRFPDQLGILLAPANGNTVASVVKTGLPWAIDNGAYTGFEEALFLRLLDRAQGQPNCLFVVAPDVVANAKATLAQWPWWAALIRSRGLPVAFVGQDGQEDYPLPDDMGAYFVGGSTRWKLSQASADLCREAKRRSLYLHVGRVNSLRRLRTAYNFGADSIDGSGYSKFGAVARSKGRTDMLLERHLDFVRQLERETAEQLNLFARLETIP
jgi:hypothetical protein